MAAIAGLVSATLIKREILPGAKKRRNFYTIVFGNAADTYPAGGIPVKVGSLTAAQSFGLSRVLQDLFIEDESNADALIYKYDRTNQKIRIYFPTQQTAGTGNRAGAEMAGSDVPAATTLVVSAEGV